MSATRYAQFCALARAAEIVGERWTLLIVRELLLGPKRFGDLAARLSDVSPTVLTARLAALVDSGVVRRSNLPPPANVPVYELTEIGHDLRPAIHALIRWGGHFLFPMRSDDTFEPDWVYLGLEAILQRDPTPKRKILVRVKQKNKVASVLVEGGDGGTLLSRSEAPASATIEARFDTLLRIISGQMPLEAAIASEEARVEGSLPVARTLPRFFNLQRGASQA